MAVTLIENGSITHKSLQDFREYAAAHPNSAFRVSNRQIDAADISDGDRVNVVVKASGNTEK